MSVSKWAYTPEKCDGDFCPGDCDRCGKAEEHGMTNEEAIAIIKQYVSPVWPPRYYEAISLAISALERDRWISVKEALPEQDQDVLVMVHWRDYPEDMMVYGRRYKTRWYLWNGELGEINKGFDITHWRPISEPPKEET